MSAPKKSQAVETSTRPAWLLPSVLGLVMVLAIGVFVWMMSSQSAQESGTPRAEIEETTINHGDVRFEQPVESVFRIRNTGDAPLVIKGEPRVQTIEGC